MGIFHQIVVLCCIDQVLLPMAKKLDIWHQIQIGLPKRIRTFLVFIYYEYNESELLPVTFLLLREHRGVLTENLPQNGVSLCSIHRQKHLIWDTHKTFTVLDRSSGFDSEQTSSKVGWVLDLRQLDTILAAPLIKNLTFARMFSFFFLKC